MTNKQKQRIAFLDSILPTSGSICVVEITTKKEQKIIKHYWPESKKSAAKLLIERDVEGTQLYVALASYKTQGTSNSGRTQVNAAYMKVFFLDIDCGKGKPYASQEEGQKALLSFCDRSELPIPTIINSGNGLYAFWLLTSDVSVDSWKVDAKKIKTLVTALEPGLDKDGIITDTARILRPVGSTHRKDPYHPKKVKVLVSKKPITFKKLKAKLDKALKKLQVSSALNQLPSNKVNDKVLIGNSISKTFMATRITKKCPVLAMVKQKKGKVSEPIWHAAIGVLRHCKEAPDIIHEWSKGHPNYSKKETDAKITQHDNPPTTCRHFGTVLPDICGKCEYRGKIKSPIKFGYRKTDRRNISDYIEDLNKEYFVSRYGGKTVVCRETFDPVLKRQSIEMSSFTDFKNFHNNKHIVVGTDRNGNPINLPLGKAWLEHTTRRQFKEIIMLPEATGTAESTGHYNLWRGFAVKPVKGSWELLKKHIHKVICDSDDVVFEYVIRWLARMIQEPWKQGEVALVLQGGRGTGKGMLGNALCRIIGQHACHVANGQHVTGNFNAHFEDCIFLFADEAFWAGDKQAESVLKGMITEPNLAIVRKGYDLKTVRNMLHVFMASNNDWVVPAGKDERRFCVLKVSECHKQDHDYFAALVKEIDNGGLEAMLYSLLNKDISDFNVREIPRTDALTEQKIQSFDPVSAWWYQKLQDGELLPGHEWDSVPFQSLFEDYLASVQKMGGNIRRANETSFAMQLRKLLPKNGLNIKRQTSKHEYRRVKHYTFPSLELCRKRFKKVLGDDTLEWV